MIYRRSRIGRYIYKLNAYISPLCDNTCIIHKRSLYLQSTNLSHYQFNGNCACNLNVQTIGSKDGQNMKLVCRCFSNTRSFNQNRFRVTRLHIPKQEQKKQNYAKRKDDEIADAFLENTKFSSVEEPHTAPPKPSFLRTAFSALFEGKQGIRKALPRTVELTKKSQVNRLEPAISTNYLIISKVSMKKLPLKSKHVMGAEDSKTASFDPSTLMPIITHNSSEERNFSFILQTNYSSLKSLFKRRSLTTKIEMPDFKNIPLLQKSLVEHDYNQMLLIVKENFDNGIMLTPEEFVRLLTKLYSRKSIAFSLVKIYVQKYDISAFDMECKRKVLMLAFHNNDFLMFDKLFQSLPNSSKIAIPSLLSVALKVYIELKSISTATQLFSYSVTSGEVLPCYVLDTYIKDLQRVTHNADLCYNAYRLWISKKLQTWPQTDAQMYQFLRRFGTLEQQDLFMGCLTRNGRATHPEILMVDLTSKLIQREQLDHFYETGGYQKWITLLKSDSILLDKFKTKMLDLNIMHGLYEKVVFTLRESACEKVFLRRLDKLLIHLSSYGQSRILCDFLLKLHRELGLKLHPYYIENIWRSLQAEYPEHTKQISIQFHDLLSNDGLGESFHFFTNLNKQFRLRNTTTRKMEHITNNNNNDNNIMLTTIEDKVKLGIHPVQHEMLIAMKRCKSRDEFRRLIRLIYRYQAELDADNLKFQIETFWKQRDLRIPIPGGRSVKTFLKRVIEEEHVLNDATLNDIIRLIMMSAKFGDYDMGIEILKQLEQRQLKPSNKIEMEKLAYCLLNFFFKKCDFKSALLLLEGIKNAKEFPISIRLVENLERIQTKYSQNIFRKLDNERDEVGETSKKKMVLKRAVYQKVMEYYSTMILIMRNKAWKESRNIDNEINYCVKGFQCWMDENGRTSKSK